MASVSWVLTPSALLKFTLPTLFAVFTHGSLSNLRCVIWMLSIFHGNICSSRFTLVPARFSGRCWFPLLWQTQGGCGEEDQDEDLEGQLEGGPDLLQGHHGAGQHHQGRPRANHQVGTYKSTKYCSKLYQSIDTFVMMTWQIDIMYRFWNFILVLILQKFLTKFLAKFCRLCVTEVFIKRDFLSSLFVSSQNVDFLSLFSR